MVSECPGCGGRYYRSGNQAKCGKCINHDGKKRHAQRIGAILGAADGLTIVVALLFGRSPALFHAALDAGIGEFVGMGAALWLTDRKQVLAAFFCGLATFLGCILPALPFLFLSGAAALFAAVAGVLSCASIICWLRPEKGKLAIAETYGVLAVAGALTYAASFLPLH